MEDGVTEAESLLHPVNLNPKDKENASTFVAKGKVKVDPAAATSCGGSGGRNGGGEGGLMNNLISNLFHPTDDAGIIENEKDNGDKVGKLETPAKASAGGGGGENGVGGGIVTNLVANLFHPTEGVGIIENEDEDEDKIRKIEKPPAAADNGGRGENGGGEGGIINKFVSNLFHPTEGGSKTENEKFDKDEVANLETPLAAAGNGGGGSDENGAGEGAGIINNLFSNLFHPTEDGGNVENEKDEEDMKARVAEENEELKKEEEGKEGKGGIIDNIVSHLPTSLPDDAAPTSDEATILINSLVRD